MESGLGDKTIVALVGDHGWSLGEHQEWAKFGNFEVDTRVPFIIHDPRCYFITVLILSSATVIYETFQEAEFVYLQVHKPIEQDR